MKPYPSLKHIIAELLPLHRTIVYPSVRTEVLPQHKVPRRGMEALRAKIASPLQRTSMN